MKLNRLFLFVALNAAIIGISILMGIIISSEAEKYIDKDVYYIAPVINDEKYFFNTEDIDEFKEVYSPAKIALERVSREIISYGNYNVYSQVAYTSSDYFSLNNIMFTGGGAWLNGSENRSIVINESLAWQLFGSLDAVGKNVFVSGENRTVTGITAQKKVSKDNAAAFLPALYEQRASAVFIKVSDYNKLAPYNNISSWMKKSGLNQQDYYVTDMNRYLDGITIKYKLIVFGVGIYMAAILIINSWKLLRNNRLNFRNIAGFAALFAVDLFLIAVLLRGISPDIWVPHSTGGRMDEIINAITNNGSLPFRDYLTSSLKELSQLNAYANTALAFGVAALFNFIFVHKGVQFKSQ